MRSILWTASVLATAVLAAPSYTPEAGDLDALNQYFQLLAVKVQDSKDAAAPPPCDLSMAQLPTSKPYDPMSSGLH